MKASDLVKLGEYFSPEDIEWKPGAMTRDKSKALAMAYITNRAIQDRLDAVCGPGDWRNEFKEGPDGGVLCGISIRVEREDGTSEWITKWDGAENTDFEAVKGGLSGSMKRAATQWAIGRYLYRLPTQWVPVDERGRFAKAPSVPASFLPSGSGDGAATSEAAVAPRRPEKRKEAGRAGGGRRAPGGKGGKRPNDEAAAYFMPRDLPR